MYDVCSPSRCYAVQQCTLLPESEAQHSFAAAGKLVVLGRERGTFCVLDFGMLECDCQTKTKKETRISQHKHLHMPTGTASTTTDKKTVDQTAGNIHWRWDGRSSMTMTCSWRKSCALLGVHSAIHPHVHLLHLSPASEISFRPFGISLDGR